MSTLKTDTVKPVTSGGSLQLAGDSGGSAVNGPKITNAGDIDFTANTDAKIKLPSAGGIYEADGSTAVLTESGGVAQLAVTAGGTADVTAANVQTAIRAAVDAAHDSVQGKLDALIQDLVDLGLLSLA